MSLFPFNRLEEQLRVSEPESATLPASDPQHFSICLASGLADLCCRAEAGSASFAVQQQGTQAFVALRSGGDAASLFNVPGQTRVTPREVYGPIAEQFHADVENVLDEIPVCDRLWLAGHGVGGAYALLAAAHLQHKGHSVAAVYTFGAPRVGNSAFARRLACPVYRVVNNLDVMPTLPAAWKWRHTGEHKLINADGSMNLNPRPWNRIPSLLRQTVWLGQLLAEGLQSGYPRPLYTLLDRVLGDHSLAAYCARLRALRDSSEAAKPNPV